MCGSTVRSTMTLPMTRHPTYLHIHTYVHTHVRTTTFSPTRPTIFHIRVYNTDTTRANIGISATYSPTGRDEVHTFATLRRSIEFDARNDDTRLHWNATLRTNSSFLKFPSDISETSDLFQVILALISERHAFGRTNERYFEKSRYNFEIILRVTCVAWLYHISLVILHRY